MVVFISLTLTLILIALFVDAELRSSLCGIALSNGVEVLVGREIYEEIIRQTRTIDGRVDWKRWDRAILEAIRLERPIESRFLARTLGRRIPETKRRGRAGAFMSAGRRSRDNARLGPASTGSPSSSCPRRAIRRRPDHVLVTRPIRNDRASRPARRRG
jgi:hypothetical protein